MLSVCSYKYIPVSHMGNMFFFLFFFLVFFCRLLLHFRLRIFSHIMYFLIIYVYFLLHNMFEPRLPGEHGYENLNNNISIVSIVG